MNRAEYRKLLSESKNSKMNKTTKYRNKALVVDGEKYDSIKESSRHADLKLMATAGLIERLERQVPYLLLPPQVRSDGLKEREVYYVADFVYYDNTLGRLVVEDVKSPVTKTRDYIIKRKLMLSVHGVSIVEV